MHVFKFFKSGHAVPPGGRLNYSKNTEFDAQCLKKYFSDQFEIFQVYWYISVGRRSGIQYGRQAAIFDFHFHSISQEAFEQLI